MSDLNQISLTTPLGRAWQRMKFFLFQPFDLGKWFVVGFAAFLAQLGSGGGSAESGLKFDGDDGWFRFEGLNRHRLEEWPDSIETFLEQVFNSMWMAGLAAFLLFLVLVFVVLFIWLSSRGRFVFLENLVSGQAGISAAWRKTSVQGNSLFLWQLVFTLICLLVFGGFAATLVMVFVPLGALGLDGALAIPLVILLGTLGFLLFVATIYVEFFLHRFIVPIMHKHGLRTNEAWARFRPLFSLNPGWFVLYGLFYLVVYLAGSLALMLGGLITCCVGLILLMIPYIGSVVSLPLSVTLRYWDLEFLGQFGPEFQLLDPVSAGSGQRSIQDDGNGTVVRAEDPAEDVGGDQPGPQDA